MINNVSKKIAFSALKMIKYGKIIVTDHDQSKHTSWLTEMVKKD